MFALVLICNVLMLSPLPLLAWVPEGSGSDLPATAAGAVDGGGGGGLGMGTGSGVARGGRDVEEGADGSPQRSSNGGAVADGERAPLLLPHLQHP